MARDNHDERYFSDDFVRAAGHYPVFRIRIIFVGDCFYETVLDTRTYIRNRQHRDFHPTRDHSRAIDYRRARLSVGRFDLDFAFMSRRYRWNARENAQSDINVWSIFRQRSRCLFYAGALCIALQERLFRDMDTDSRVDALFICAISKIFTDLDYEGKSQPIWQMGIFLDGFRSYFGFYARSYDYIAVNGHDDLSLNLFIFCFCLERWVLCDPNKSS